MKDEEKKKPTPWLVKDSAGEYIAITADSWECGGNGLKFYLNGRLISWFASWQHWREVDQV